MFGFLKANIFGVPSQFYAKMSLLISVSGVTLTGGLAGPAGDGHLPGVGEERVMLMPSHVGTETLKIILEMYLGKGLLCLQLAN